MAPPPPPEEELVEETLLRLPPTSPRTSSAPPSPASPGWRRLLTGPAFRRRYRAFLPPDAPDARLLPQRPLPRRRRPPASSLLYAVAFAEGADHAGAGLQPPRMKRCIHSLEHAAIRILVGFSPPLGS
ncbi:hypothetical protein ACP4OV_012062 [Aristida adscensionis]